MLKTCFGTRPAGFVRWRLLSFVMVTLFVCTPASAETYTGEEAVAMLDHIERGYEANRARTGELHLTGRMSTEQYAEPGMEVREGLISPYVSVDFQYFEKEGKRRFESGIFTEPDLKHYLLDNNEKIVALGANLISIFPMQHEDGTWAISTDNWGEAQAVRRSEGRETLGANMRTLADKARSKTEESPYPVVSVTVEDGVYRVEVLRSPSWTEKYWVDAGKGYNLLKFESVEAHRKIDEKFTAESEYVPDDTGHWVLKKWVKSGNYKAVRFRRTLDVTQIEAGQLGLSDDLFEIGSLTIPAEHLTVTDFRFTPPVVMENPTSFDTQLADVLDSVDISLDEVAVVDPTGNVATKANSFFDEDVRGREDTHSGGLPKLGIALAVVLAGILLALVMTWYRRKGPTPQ